MIAIVTNEMSTTGGTQKQVINFSRFISERENLILISYTPKFNYGYNVDFIDEQNILAIPRSNNRYLSRFLSTMYMIRKLKNIKIVSLHDTGLEFEAIVLALLGKKIYWQINDLHGSFQVGAHKNKKLSMKDLINKNLSKILAKLVCEIHVNVSKNADLVYEHLNKKALVFYPGVDLPRVEKSEIVQSGTILSIGVLFPYRNYEKLILAVANINDKFNLSYRLKIVGKYEHNMDYKYKLEKLAHDKSVTVEFLGQISNEQINDEWENAEIFAFLNVDQSWGLSIFESIGTNTPTLISESVGAVELLKNYDPVQKCNAEDVGAIATSILDLRDKYTNNPKLYLDQRSFIKNMSWDKMYSKRAYSRLNK